MRREVDSETLYRAAAGIALAIGVLALISPKLALRIYGVDPDRVTGPGAFGWRLFAVRNIVIGAAAIRGSRAARDTALLVQPPDQLVFLHAWRTGGIPAHTAAMALATSAAVAGLSLQARRAAPA